MKQILFLFFMLFAVPSQAKMTVNNGPFTTTCGQYVLTIETAYGGHLVATLFPQQGIWIELPQSDFPKQTVLYSVETGKRADLYFDSEEKLILAIYLNKVAYLDNRPETVLNCK